MPVTGNAPRTARLFAPKLTFAATAAAARPLHTGWLASTALFLALFLAASAVHAHGGGLNKDGRQHERRTGGITLNGEAADSQMSSGIIRVISPFAEAI